MTALVEALAFAAHFAIALLLVSVAGPAGVTARGLRLCLAFPLGLGLAAASAFWELQLRGVWDARWRWGEIGAGCLAVLAAAGRRRTANPASGARAAAASAAVPAGLRWFAGGLALLFLVQIALRACASPTGSYDASANWNLRARAFLLGPERWREFLANQPGIPHPDYPGLLPLTVTRCWRVLDEAVPAVPLVLGVLCAAVTVAIVGAGLTARRGSRIGLLGAAFLLATPELPRQAVAQIADIPLAMSFAGAGLVAWGLVDTRNATVRAWALCGGLLGVGLWTKNEGSVFALAFAAVATAIVARTCGLRAAARALIGLGLAIAPFAATLILWKSHAPIANELLPWGRMHDVLPLLIDTSRWWIAGREIGSRLLTYGHFLFPAVVVAIVVLRRSQPSPPAITAGLVLLSAVLATMLLSHLGIALLTPYALQFHIESTQSRLLLQLWPLAVAALCALITDPWNPHPQQRPTPAP